MALVAADVSPRTRKESAPTHVVGYGSGSVSSSARNTELTGRPIPRLTGKSNKVRALAAQFH